MSSVWWSRACEFVVLARTDLNLQAPPLHPWPQVAAELGNLEESRERMENLNMDKLQTEFNKAAIDARQRIGDIIGRTMRVFNDPDIVNAIFLARPVLHITCIWCLARAIVWKA